MTLTIDELVKRVGAWLGGEGPYADIVISSRIRLARNLDGFPFLSKSSDSDRSQVYRVLMESIAELELGEDTLVVDIEDADELDRQVLVERHLISRQHAEGEGTRGVAIANNEQCALMINEEDHLRIQGMRSGLQLACLFEEVNRIDNEIGQRVRYAFDRRWGYLTACPTNVGTGIRVSVMLHLPALKLTGQIEQMFRAAKEMHLAVRGLYGEGTDAVGDFFQVSNQTTLGQTEKDIVEEFASEIIPRIVKFELTAREMLEKDRSALLDDKIWRAWGTLENARTMSSDETLFLLSHLRMGVNMGRCKDIDLTRLNQLFLRSQPAHLQKLEGRRLDGEQRSVARARYLRSILDSHN